MMASEGFAIELVVGGMEQRGWRLLGVNNPPAIHMTLDVMEEEYLQRFLSDLEEIVASIKNGELTQEGDLAYGGVGAGVTPKWLTSAVEIMMKQHEG